MKSALLLRLGGLGDIVILTPVAKELIRRGYEVDLCAGSPTCNTEKLLGNLGLFRKIIKMDKYPANGLDVYKVNETDWAGTELLKEGYDLIVDYKNSIEMNTHYRHMAISPGKEWFVSQNSNYVNWYDMMFAWAGIDPSKINDEDKAPIYKVNEEEKTWASKIVKSSNYDKVVAIQLNASSLVRTWYSPQQLPRAIRDEFPDKEIAVLFFDGSIWHFLKGKYDFPIVIPKNFDPIRASAALVNESNLFISADSGFSHLAEAMGIKSLTVFTTVPPWTRNKYYKHAKSIEPVGDTFYDVQCRPCFVLDRYCPRIREKAFEELTDRERKIKESAERGRNPMDVALELNTTPQGIMMEAEMMTKRYQALLEMQAPCSATITTERILKEVREML